MNLKTLQKITLSLSLLFAAHSASGQCSVTFSGGGFICENSGQSIDILVSFTGTGPWTFEYQIDGIPQPPITTPNNPYTLTVSQPGLYEPTAVSTPTCSSGTTSGNALVTEVPELTLSNPTYDCGPFAIDYTVSFAINGGDPATYTVSPPNGSLSGNVFTSDPIPSGLGFSFIVSDASSCPEVELSEFALDCDCISQAGAMGPNPINACADGPVTAFYDASSEFYDGDDVLNFVLHVGSGINIQPPIIGFLQTPSVGFDPGTMEFGTTYYLSAVVGNDDGTGNVELIAPCLDISPGTPITFFDCTCETAVGTMDFTPLQVAVCNGETATATYDPTGEFLDGDDVLAFVLTDALGNFLQFNTQPTFGFDPATMLGGQTYFISAIAGNVDGTGGIDLNDICLAVAQPGQPVIFGLEINLTLDVLNAECPGEATFVNVDVAGGIPPLAFIWSDGQVGQTAQFFTSGTYIVTVSDDAGCTASTPVFVDILQGPICDVFINGELSCLNNVLVVDLLCPGGTPPLFFAWSWPGGPFITEPGNYEVTVTDVNGCAEIVSFTIGAAPEDCGVIRGTVADDVNPDCLLDASDIPLQNWMVKATGDFNFFALTNSLGEYSMDVFAGEYEMEIVPPYPGYWQACQSPVTTLIEDEGDVDTLDFLMEKLVDCPLLEVDISAPFTRRCSTSTYVVSYCNLGTAPAEDATVEVTFDAVLEVLSASLPWSSQVGNTFTFELGDVPVGGCGSFTVLAKVDCTIPLGSTACAEAHIFPDSLCVPAPGWSGASIELTSECDGDSVFFTLTNVGTGNMIDPLVYIVIEDGVMLLDVSDGPPLGVGESYTFGLPANGATYVILAEQVPDHPGNSAPMLALEGCGVNGNGTFSIGFASQLPEDDDDPFVSIDCHPVIGPYDPNDKTGYPLGFGDEHFIELGQDLDYHIRFQNTGTDTAFNVRLVDVISEKLDLATLRPGAASHDYEVQILGSDTLVFLFPNIMLPDSNVNEAGSHGFVKFRISQSASNELNDVIENTAGIYFDFNDPIITNTTVHVLGEHFIPPTASHEAARPQVQWALLPNPASGETMLLLRGDLPQGEITLSLHDLTGRAVQSHRFHAPVCQFDVSNLPAGIYFFEMKMEGARIGQGKLAVE